MSLRVHLIEVIKRMTNFNKTLGIIENGEHNTYPQLIDRYINNSVTAKTSWGMMSNYIAGRGFGDLDSIIVNKEKGTTLKMFGIKLAKVLTKHRGAFIHVNYDANFEMSSFDLIPFSHCRIGKKDDTKYNGKILIHEDWDIKIKKTELEVLDVYNPRENVIDAQVEALKGETKEEKWNTYKGQILFINFDEDYDYPLSTIDPVINDCDSEAQSSIYKNKSLRKGFSGTTIVVTKPLVGDSNTYENPAAYQTAQNERNAFRKGLEDILGAENKGGFLTVEVETFSDKLDEVIKFVNIPGNIDDKLHKYTEESIFNNILMAFNNITPAMVRADNALYGNSGEALIQMRKMYQDNIEQEQKVFLEIIQKLAFRFNDLKDKEIEIVPLIEKDGKIDK